MEYITLVFQVGPALEAVIDNKRTMDILDALYVLNLGLPFENEISSCATVGLKPKLVASQS